LTDHRPTKVAGQVEPGPERVTARGSASRRRLVLSFRRTTDPQSDLSLFRQTNVILAEHSGGSDVVEMIIVGMDRPRVELEWPSLGIRWDRQLERKLSDVLGPSAVHVESIEERESAVA